MYETALGYLVGREATREKDRVSCEVDQESAEAETRCVARDSFPTTGRNPLDSFGIHDKCRKHRVKNDLKFAQTI